MNIFINSNEDLTRHCKRLAQQDYIALDTEFIAKNSTYYPDLALIQIAYQATAEDLANPSNLAVNSGSVLSSNSNALTKKIGGNNKELIILLIDAKAQLDMSELKEVLENRQIIKVIHACQQDHLALQYNINCTMRGIFDSQIAYAFMSEYRNISYRSLVENYSGIKITKDSQVSDWLKRPLDTKQLEYAANDVNYLYRIYPLIAQNISEKNYSHWLEEEIMNSIKEIENERPKIEKTFLSLIINEAKDLDNKKSAPYLMRLIELREKIAQKYNLGRQQVMNEQEMQNTVYCIIEEKDRIPRSILRMQSTYGLTKEISEQIINPLQREEIDYYLELRLKSEKALHNSFNESPHYQKLSALLAEISQETEIAESLIASQWELRNVCPADKKEKMETGWRWELFWRRAWDEVLDHNL